MKVPSWLNGQVDEKDLDAIEEAVQRAEARTSAEFVPMIVRKSISTDHVPVILFLGQLLVLILLLPYFSQFTPGVPFYALELVAVAIALVSTWLQRNVDFWQRVLTSSSDRRDAVLRRAQLEFFTSGIKATAQSTGVLIFVSFVEHQAVILADRAILEKLPEETWAKVVERLVTNVKNGNFRGGFSGAVAEVSELLQEKFPIQAGDKNELHNHLIIQE